MTSCRRGGGGVQVRMTNNVEGCMKKHDRGGGGGGVKMPQNSMTSFMDDPFVFSLTQNMSIASGTKDKLTFEEKEIQYHKEV